MSTTATKLDENSLQAHLEDRAKSSRKNATKENIQIAEEGIESVFKSGLINSAKHSGDKAPDFTLTKQDGEEVRLSELLKTGPVILTWYRGGWDPYCNITLNYLQEKLPEFIAVGASLLVLTPVRPERSAKTIENLGLEFTVLNDLGNEVAKAYDIVYTLTDEVANAYQEAFDLHSYNGDSTNELPLAATYVIDKDGFIRYTFLSADYKKRAEPKDIITALEGLKK